MDDTLSILIIEWDGGRPPTTWYNRLQKLGYKVRGSKETSPLARRANSSQGVIAQEGALICNSQSEARSLGFLARQLGAKSIMVGKLETTVMEMTNEDALAIQRIEATLGKRGKPAAGSGEKEWTVTCMDEMTSHYFRGRNPVNCPHCGSFRITAREGSPATYTDNGAEIGEVWAWTRFVYGQFEEPQMGEQVDADAPLPPQLSFMGTEEAKKIEALRGSTLYNQITSLIGAGEITRKQAFRWLDLGYAVMTLPKPQRQAGRLAGIQTYFERGGSPVGVELVARDGDIDLFDLISKDRMVVYQALKMAQNV